MKRFEHLFKISLVFLVLTLSFLLRYKNFDKIPFPGESMDEYSYSWVGMSLIKIGIPVGISGIDGYKNSMSSYENMDNVFQGTSGGNPQTINWPWFDHPPMLGLITGGYAISKGATNFKEANIFIVRKPMLVLGVISVLMVTLFCWLNFGFVTGLVSGLIYGVMPVVVVGSRMVQGENGVIPFYLAALLLISLFYKYGDKKWLILSAIFSGVSCLFKLSGLVSVLTIILFILNKSKSRKADLGYFSIISLSVASLFLWYGLIIDGNQFLAIFLSNSNRFYGIGPESIFRLITQVKITNVKFLTDPFVLMGWLSFLMLVFRGSKNMGEKLIYLAGLCWLVMYIVLGSYAHGWYAFPFYPILTMSSARAWGLAYKNKKYLSGILILLVMGIGYFLSRLIKIESFQQYSSLWKISVGVLFISSNVVTILKFKFSKYVCKGLLWGMLISLLVLAVIILNQMSVDSWYGVL